MNGNLLKKNWSEVDDSKLQKAVSTYGEGNWALISTQVPGFTPQQCIYRWKKHLKTGISKGRWKPNEDKQLIISVAFNGTNWSRVAETVPTKTDVQCRERWINVLSPDIKSGPWSEEEDKQLLDAVTEFGVGKWAKISKKMSGRTDNACWRRWKDINRVQNTNEVVEDYRKSLYVMKRLLPSNHGGSKDKSELTLDDMDSNMVDKVAAQKRTKSIEKKVKPKQKADSNSGGLKPPPRKRGRPGKEIESSSSSSSSMTYPVFIPTKISPTIMAQIEKLKRSNKEQNNTN